VSQNDVRELLNLSFPASGRDGGLSMPFDLFDQGMREASSSSYSFGIVNLLTWYVVLLAIIVNSFEVVYVLLLPMLC
jgi:hypothetical protein